MMNLKQLKYYKDSTVKASDSVARSYSRQVLPLIKFSPGNLSSKTSKPKDIPTYKKAVVEIIPVALRSRSIEFAQNEMRSVKETIALKVTESDDYQKSILRFIVEYQPKFTLAVSCLILFSIGAPLGAIIRKGGLGLPVVMSILFFLIYHIISTIGEKSAKAGTIDPIFGMWVAIIVLAPLGVFLTYKAAVDSVIFDADSYKQKFLKLIKKKS